MFRGLKLGEITKPYHLAEHCKNRDLGVDVVVPEFLRTLVFARPRGDDQFADCTFSPSLDMSR